MGKIKALVDHRCGIEITPQMIDQAVTEFNQHDLVSGATGTWNPEWSYPVVKKILQAALLLRDYDSESIT